MVVIVNFLFCAGVL